MEVIVGGFGAIVLQIVPVEMVVVDEGAIEDDAAMWFQGTGNDVRGIGMATTVGGRARSSFRISFDDNAAEVWNLSVNQIHFLLPPLGDAWVERIECIQTAFFFRSAGNHRE